MLDEVHIDNQNESRGDTSSVGSQSAHLRALQGSLADIPVTSDDFARLKQEVIEREEQKFARLFPDAK